MAEEKPADTQKVPSRTATGINWTGAFLLFVKGATLPEISKQLNVPLGKLQAKCRSEDWERLIALSGSLALRAPDASICAQSAALLKGSEDEIKANRADALKVARGLRQHILMKLKAAEDAQVTLTVQDISKLAMAARAIDETSMLALGDDPAPKIQPLKGAEGPVAPTGPVTHFHIHPPAQALRPRVVTEAGEVRAFASKQVDAILTPARVELEPVEVPDPAVDVGGGRSSVDFRKLAADIASVDPKGKALPDFARTG